MTISGDNPIRHPEDDTLGRTAVAESFARQVLALDRHIIYSAPS